MENKPREFCYEIKENKIYFYSREIKKGVYSDKKPLQFIGLALIDSPEKDTDTIRKRLEDWLKTVPMRDKCSQEIPYIAHQLVQNNIALIGKSIYIHKHGLS